MAYETRQTLKNFFKTGDKPTQAQFAALIDSLFNINDDSGRMVRDLLYTIHGNDRLVKSSVRGADFALNLRGIGDLYDASFRADLNNILIGDTWIMGATASPIEGDTADLKPYDWVIARQNNASISNFGDPDKWYVVRIGTILTPKEFMLISNSGSTINLNGKPSDKLKFEHKTSPGTIIINSFGTGVNGMQKKLWIELKNDSAYKVQINSTSLGSSGIFIPGITGSGNVTYTGNPVNPTLNHIFIDAVCLASGQWIVANISQATAGTGPKSPEADQVELSGDYYLTLFENQIFPNCVLTDDTDILADFENEVFTNGTRVVMLIDGNGHELSFGPDFTVIFGQFNTAAGHLNLVDMIYNPISGVSVSIYNDLAESTTNKENTTIDSSSTKYPTVALLKTVYDSWLNQQWYGIEWDISVSSPDCARIGNGDLHRSLPVQSAFKACLLNDDGSVNYYLNPNDWDSKEGGGDSDLTGADGQVMIEIPEHYRRFESDAYKRRFMVSQFPLSGYTKVNKQYISAFEAALDRSNSKLCSIINADANYRGGTNTSAWDAEDRTLLGKPVTNLSRTQFRTYARARGSKWNLYHYDAHLTISYLFFLEYATLNSQKAYNAARDLNGYMQGGLGNGVTDINSTNWNTWNSYNPFINCGYSNLLGTKSGVSAFAMPAGYGATLTTYVNRYRGIELPFGHLWKHADGITVNAQAAGYGNSEHQFYLTTDPTKWNDADLTGYTKIAALPRADGYIKEMINGHIMPSINSGAGSTTYFCDYFYQSIPASGEVLRSVLFCGLAYYGAYAGFAFSTTNYPPSYAHAFFGSRLCCI